MLPQMMGHRFLEEAPQSSLPSHRPSESIHHRLIECVRNAFINIFVFPYATVCVLYCGKVPDTEKWDEAQIGHFIGVDLVSSGVDEVRDAWESQRKVYTSEFLEFDPFTEDIELHWKNKENKADVVFCMHFPLYAENEEKVTRLLQNVSSLLKPGGYFLGINPDSSTIWAKYQKHVEAYHNKGGIFPNCIRSESYMITFEVEEEKFPFFGKKYQLRFSGDSSAETHFLVHFPSLIRLAREAGLEFVEIQNLTDFYDDYRAPLTGMLVDIGHILFDQRGRLLPRAYDILSLYTTFIFQKPDPDLAPPLMTPMLEDDPCHLDEIDWQIVARRDDDKNLQMDLPSAASLAKITEQKCIIRREDDKNLQMELSSAALAKITEQKGILGPGPAALRFPEAL